MYSRFLILVLLLLSGCSQKVNHTVATLDMAINGLSDVELTAQQVRQIPYASMSVRIGDGPLVLMVLAFYENGEAKWVSADSAMIVTRNGRIVKTIGLYGDNLDGLTNLAADPIAAAQLTHMEGAEWQRQADWSPQNRYGFRLSSRFSQQGEEVITVLDKTLRLRAITEQVTLPQQQQSYQNRFWLEADTGLVIKSLQQLGPQMPVIELTLLKRYHG